MNRLQQNRALVPDIVRNKEAKRQMTVPRGRGPEALEAQARMQKVAALTSSSRSQRPGGKRGMNASSRFGRLWNTRRRRLMGSWVELNAGVGPRPGVQGQGQRLPRGAQLHRAHPRSHTRSCA